MRQSDDMRASISAANAANELVRANFVADQRPWIVIEIAVTGDAQLHTGKQLGGLSIDDKRIIVGFTLKLKNIGKAPAQNALVNAEIIFMQSDVSEDQRRICAEALEKREQHRSGITIFPDRDYAAQWSAQATAAEMHSRAKEPLSNATF